MKSYYLDTETLGLDPSLGLCEIAIVNDAGRVVLHSLIDPQRPIPPEASAIHGILDVDVEGCPTLAELLPVVTRILSGSELIIYNKRFDLALLPGVEEVCASVECAMAYAQDAMGLTRWPKLSAAAAWAGYEWEGKAHTAVADALAARHVWQHIQKLKAAPKPEAPAEIPLLPVISSNILAVGYDEPSRTLAVQFISGDVYRYADVPPQAHAALMAAKSIGKHFGAEIKPRFQFVKMGKL